jgi:amino-acid N-acetyltransferase
MTALAAHRCGSVIGNFVRARGLGVIGGIDMEYTGRVEKVLVKPVGKILDSGMIPVLPCIAWSASGKPYNVPSDEIALSAASALGAAKLFIVSAGKNLSALKLPGNPEAAPAISGKPAARIVRLTPKEAEAILNANMDAGAKLNVNNDAEKNAAGAAAKGLSELRLALAAAKAGVERIHIIDGREEGAVLQELFSNLGAGTMVYADEYEAIRPLETHDIPDVLRIMEPLMKQGILVRRNAESILEKKEDYWVFGIDGQAHACGALHYWGDEGEIAAIAVDSAYADMGVGSRIVRFLINKAEKDGLRKVFALTTQTQDWFETLGFKESDAQSLPEERKKNYNSERKSKIYSMELK